ncbi:MAG: NUDIX hydrolase [Clostridia bacterium]|nr:NUDIX hydrolase [Clostridia bacterium]
MTEIRNKDGLTEKEFLAQYDASRFPPVFVTVDVVLLNGPKVLLIRRGNHPWIGKLALPGGFVEPDDDAESAARRELTEETGIGNVVLKQLPVKSRPDRDPRARIVTVPFLGHFVSGETPAQAGDDAAEAGWWDIETTDLGETLDIRLTRGNETESFRVRRSFFPSHHPSDPVYTVEGDSPLASDHAEILASALDVEHRNY